jgi:undecaprenyl-diphosphatase
MSWMAAHTTPLGFQIASFVTRFGGDPVMPALGLGGAFVLWHQRHRLVLACWLAAFFGGIAVDKLLKHLVHRTRPVLAMTRMHETSFSFPSGHTMAATIGYGMLAYVLATYWAPTIVRRRVLYSLAAIVTLLVGMSRIYLGMHFPTDVIGGFAAGTAWLAICVTGTRIARQGTPPDPARANTGRGAQAAGSGHRRGGAVGNYDAADATDAAG